jgi:hypothetical protein
MLAPAAAVSIDTCTDCNAEDQAGGVVRRFKDASLSRLR